MKDELGAFVPHVDCVVQGARTGPLAGLSFAAKDLFAVAGYRTGGGNPDWERTHPPARRHAWAVQALLDAGATLVGKTITDEISLGLIGRNQFYGTPINPKAPDRVPGGSSSGSAAAVAGGLVDTALGTDSGGSVRTPASFCGLYGLRPTHGRIPVEGMDTQSPTFDTCGWLAADAETFVRVGEVLLQAKASEVRPAELLIATDCFGIAVPEVQSALATVVERLSGASGQRREVELGEGDLPAWWENQRKLQMGEFGKTFRPWVERVVPRFSIEVGRSLTLASLLTEDELEGPKAFRAKARARLEGLLGADKVLCLPTTPILPPLRNESFTQLTTAVGRIIELTCIAGLTGLPQVNLPLGNYRGIPVGLSLIGWRGSDEVLLGLAKALA
ncbi:MAG TPA: amidase [Geminicoccus sp.]|jgi:amidase|uniref:amidase n=1 Tax=Geminicoccus sp. TaxID=2024832 RepID=UPI002E364F5D|nr:amidase [Geminicoccus sp.]HEX2525399.1 amidase [Geminicoccus sp.]